MTATIGHPIPGKTLSVTPMSSIGKPELSKADRDMIFGLACNRDMTAEQIARFIFTPDRDLSAEDIERVIAEQGRG